MFPWSKWPLGFKESLLEWRWDKARSCGKEVWRGRSVRSIGDKCRVEREARASFCYRVGDKAGGLVLQEPGER